MPSLRFTSLNIITSLKTTVICHHNMAAVSKRSDCISKQDVFVKHEHVKV